MTVPNVVGKTLDEAIETLVEAGFTYTTEEANSDTIEIGSVIKTKPKAGSTRKKGDTITIVESIGGKFEYLENYIGQDYYKVKAELEHLGINILTEKIDPNEIENEEYKDKENIIVKQEPAFDENNKQLLKDDIIEITLWIPDIVDEYPDMVNEGWTLNDVIAFAKEFNLNLTVFDSTTNQIPENEYEQYKDIKVIEQSKPVGYTIIKGFNFNVNINTQYKKQEETTNQDQGTNENTTIVPQN